MKKEVEEEEEEVFSWNNNSLLKLKAFITGIEVLETHLGV